MKYACLGCLLLLAACGSGYEPETNADKRDTAPVEPVEQVERPDTAVDDANKRRAAELFARAGDAILEQRLPEAAEVMELAVELDPTNGEYHARHGHVLEKLLRFGDAREAFLTAARYESGRNRAELESRAAAASHHMARRAYIDGNNRPALEHIRDSLKLNPASGEAWLMKGFILFNMDEGEDAVEAFGHAADILPGAQRNEALFWLGMSHHRLEQFEQADAAYTRAIEAGYRAGDIYGWRGRVRADLGRRAEAIHDLNRAIDLASGHVAREEFRQDVADLQARDE